MKLSQRELYDFLKKRDDWCSVGLLVQHFKIRQTTINKSLKQLHKHGLIIIIIDGRRHLVRIKEEK